MSAPTLETPATASTAEASQSATNQPTVTRAMVAIYRTHQQAESAVRILTENGIPPHAISIVGRNFETNEQVVGFYQPGDAAVAGAAEGAWFGGFFGLLLGAVGLFVFPVVGALVVLGPLSGLIAGAVGGAGIGALISALVALGIPREQAIRYQERLQAGEFMLIVNGSEADTAKAHELLLATPQIHIQHHTSMPGDTSIIM